jgi:predicted permease
MMRWNNVGPDFFGTLGVPMLDGRDFSDADTDKSAPVAIVNRTMMHRTFKDRNPIGHAVSFSTQKAFTIVGVVEDSKYTGVEEKPIPMAWFPYTQVGDFGAMHVEVRTTGPAAAALPLVREVVAKFAPNTALLQPRTQQEEFDRTIATERLLARLSITFAALAMIMVAIGLYGTLAYSVTRRTSELGLRMALGAERGQVLWMFLRGGLLLGAAGLMVGTPLVFATTRLLSSLLYGVAPSDPMSILLAAAAIFAIAAAATYLPARRAARVDPMVALRYE